ncbi:hypothetical protein [Rhizobium sp. S163]|uniref:hypothetical protein n=1 Tax=Rhizobium sp. S163 TaxID=3055039 RepID=UPI0025A9A4B7|nr:hypothetical protein [Rhizobium sp. S163]MDM9643841.1 hypothetical protein [Rhizobium sp. S163]
MSENIPAGWKLVPIDATKALEEAAVSRVRPYHDTDWSQHMPKDLFRLAWPALLDAAPQPPLSKPGGTSVANFEAHLTRILEEYEQRREAIQEDEEVKDRFIILRAFELAVAAREDQP